MKKGFFIRRLVVKSEIDSPYFFFLVGSFFALTHSTTCEKREFLPSFVER